MRDFAPGCSFTGKEAKKFAQFPVNPKLCEVLGFQPKESSIDEMESMLQLLTDVQEQFWAKTRSDQCPQEIK